MAVEGRGDYRQRLVRRMNSRDSAKRKRELAFSSPAKNAREAAGATFDRSRQQYTFTRREDNPARGNLLLSTIEPYAKTVAGIEGARRNVMAGLSLGVRGLYAPTETRRPGDTADNTILESILQRIPVSERAKEESRASFTSDPGLSDPLFVGLDIVDPSPGGAAASQGLLAPLMGAIRGLVRQSPEARALEKSDPYDVKYSGRDRLLDKRTYEAAQTLLPDRLPDPVAEYGNVVELPSGFKPTYVRDVLKQLQQGYRGTPTTADQINATARNGVTRVNEILDASPDYGNIIGKYGATRPTVSVPKISRKKLKELHTNYEKDMGNAWSFDPVSGDIITTNNEHVFSVSPEALRHVFELRQLDRKLDASDLSDKDKRSAVQKLLDQQADEMRTILDPNQAMLILTEHANQRVVKSMDPSSKIPAFMASEGGRFIPIPYREGETFGATSPMGATAGAYMDVIEAVGAKQPSLVTIEAKNFRNRYNTVVKPLRDAMIRTKDPKKKADLLRQIEEAENSLGEEFGYF